MLGAFRRNRETEQLPGQTDRVIANVDHLLHFALPFRQDLARLERHEPPQILTRRPQFFTEQTDELTALRRRHCAPRKERLMRTFDLLTRFLSGALLQPPHDIAADRRTRDQSAAAHPLSRHPEPRQCRGHVLNNG